MRQLDSAERDGCSSIRLETCHPGAAALDRTMILFDQGFSWPRISSDLTSVL
jgi:hypothetical protein